MTGMKTIRLKIYHTHNFTVLNNMLNREILNCIEQCSAAPRLAPQIAVLPWQDSGCARRFHVLAICSRSMQSRPSYSVVLVGNAADTNPPVFSCLLFSRVDSSPTDISLHHLMLILILPRFLFFCSNFFYSA